MNLKQIITPEKLNVQLQGVEPLDVNIKRITTYDILNIDIDKVHGSRRGTLRVKTE